MPIFLGLDDTDHPDFGCTTEKMNDLLEYLLSRTDSVLNERRLVRLWPFAKRRTRGNGALGAKITIAMEEIELFHSLCSNWFSELCAEIEEYPEAEFNPSPCLIISDSKAPEEWYWSSVREEVDSMERLCEVEDSGCSVFLHKSSWGIVGASAAISWSPKTNSSWELIAWRDEGKIGTARQVSESAVFGIGQLHSGAFVNRDPTKGRGMIAPRTPCPVLYGIRGSTSRSVEDAHLWLQQREDVEKCSCYAVHRTNQLSDDHIETPLSGTVTCLPSSTKGGHAVIGAITSVGPKKLVAFSEGGPVNRTLRSLMPGDQISWTGLDSPEGSVHLEKLRLDKSSPRIIGRPVCCNGTMRSQGRDQGVRCDSCGREETKYWRSIPMAVCHETGSEGWVEPSPSNRRHLAKPVSLME